jgi:hypothetical protein
MKFAFDSFLFLLSSPSENEFVTFWSSSFEAHKVSGSGTSARMEYSWIPLSWKTGNLFLQTRLLIMCIAISWRFLFLGCAWMSSGKEELASSWSEFPTNSIQLKFQLLNFEKHTTTSRVSLFTSPSPREKWWKNCLRPRYMRTKREIPQRANTKKSSSWRWLMEDYGFEWEKRARHRNCFHIRQKKDEKVIY